MPTELESSQSPSVEGGGEKHPVRNQSLYWFNCAGSVSYKGRNIWICESAHLSDRLYKEPCRKERFIIEDRTGRRTRVEAGSNTSTMTLRIVGGDEKGSLETETVKYGRESQRTRTRERLRWL
jgi:hypothetical protein